jgi:hypothetical protein
MKRYTKVILILLLVITAFHLSGVETAFCKDSATQVTEAHGCMTCEPNHHTAVLPQLTTSFAVFPVSFLSPEILTMKQQELAPFILRPPISS